MNAFLIVSGAILIVTGVIRSCVVTSSAPAPKHGDMRIVKESDGAYWTQKYYAFPCWSSENRHSSLESARQEKARWDAIHQMGRSSETKVVEGP